MSKKTKGKEYFTIVGYLNQWEEAKIENNIDTNYDEGGSLYKQIPHYYFFFL